MKKNKGFTLIELLVVIAIIGILSAVVLASLNTARSKAADAAVKSNLANARAEAELYYDTNTNYAPVANAAGGIGVCQNNTTANIIGDSVLAALNASGSTLAVSATCFAGGGAGFTPTTNGWAAYAPLKSNSAQFYCVDSTGQATTTTVAAGGIAAGDLVCG